MRVLQLTWRGVASAVAYGRSGRRLVAASSKLLHFWSLETFELEETWARSQTPLSAMDCMFVPGGSAFLEANGYWPAGEELPTDRNLTGDHAWLIRGLTPQEGFFCFTTDGRGFFRESHSAPLRSPLRLAVCGLEGKLLRSYPQAGFVGPRHAAFSPSGSLLAVAGAGSEVVVWDTATGDEAAKMVHTDTIYGLSFSPDGRRLATAAGRLVRIWEVPSGRLMHRFRAFRGRTECLAFSRDGSMVVAGSREGRTRIWDAEGGRELCDHTWGKGEVLAVAFSPDGLTAAAGCAKQAVVVWDVDV